MPSLKTKVNTPLITETKEFYVSLFAMTVVEEWDSDDDRGVILEFSDGHREALLEIYHSEEALDYSVLSLQFRVDDVEEFASRLPDRIVSAGPVARPWGSRYLYLSDPNGISVIVYDGGW